MTCRPSGAQTGLLVATGRGTTLADDAPTTPRPCDVGTVRYLLELMTQHDLSEIDLHEGDQRIRLRRGPVGPAALPQGYFPVPAHAPAPAAAAAAPNSAPAAPEKKYHEIRSEL